MKPARRVVAFCTALVVLSLCTWMSVMGSMHHNLQTIGNASHLDFAAAKAVSRTSPMPSLGILDAYRDLHNRIMDPDETVTPKRFFVHRAGLNNGWANRFQNLLSAFLFCIVTDRALLVQWDVGHRPDDSFEMPFGTWILEDAKRRLPLVPELHSDKQWGGIDVNHGSRKIPIDTLLCEDYSKHWGDAVVVANDGCAISWMELIWNNPRYQNLLRSHGFVYGKVSSTLAKFLITPHPEIAKAVQEFQAEHQASFTIALQIRAGEGQLASRSELPSKMLECASLLAKTLPPHQRERLVYFVASDSPQWFEAAAKNLAHLTPADALMGIATPRVVRQPVFLESGMVGNKGARESTQQLQAALVDLWLLASANETILTQGSTFGAISQLFSERNEPLYITRQSHCVRYMAAEIPDVWLGKYMLRHFREGHGRCYGPQPPVSLSATNGLGQGFDMTVSDPEQYILKSYWGNVHYIN
jgi:hypothetical protein